MRKYYCKICRKEVELERYPIRCPTCNKMILKKDFLGIMGEYIVTSELISRNKYSQVTFGNMKKMDLLVNYQDNDEKEYFKIIEVKTKQDLKFFWFHGIPLNDVNRLVVFVDFKNKKFDEKPDFYVLNSKDVLVNLIEQMKWYVERCKTSAKALTNINSTFIQNHPRCTLEIKEIGDQVQFYLKDSPDMYKMAYLEKTPGTLYTLFREKSGKERYRALGLDFHTSKMGRYKDKWEKI